MSDGGKHGGEKKFSAVRLPAYDRRTRPSVLASAAQTRGSPCITSNSGCSCASMGSAASPDVSRSLETRARACQIGQTRADLSSFASAERGESRLTDHRHRPAPFIQERGAGRYKQWPCKIERDPAPRSELSEAHSGLDQKYETLMINKWYYRDD